MSRTSKVSSDLNVVGKHSVRSAGKNAVKSQANVSLGKFSLLSLALAASFAPAAAQADCSAGGGMIVSLQPGMQTWNSWNCEITPGAMISGGSIGMIASVAGGTLTNLGSFDTVNVGVLNNLGSSISLLNNAGAISASQRGIFNRGTIAALTNSGTIRADAIGIDNNGAIGELINDGTIVGGTATGGAAGIHVNDGASIGTLKNTSTGTIRGYTGVLLGNSPAGNTPIHVGTLNNAGLIEGTNLTGVGTSANATIDVLLNTGTIMGAAGGIGNAGTIGTLNNSGVISSNGFAVYADVNGSIGAINNAGLISGNVANLSVNSLTINGAMVSGMGTLTGANGNIGTILSPFANLVFGTGKLLLNDTVNVGTNTVYSTGATLQVNNQISITGNYHQGASGTLLVGVGDNTSISLQGVVSEGGYGRLIVSGAATLDNGATIALKSTGSYGFAPGQRFIVIEAATAGTNFNLPNLQYSVAGYNGTVQVSSFPNGSNSELLLTLGLPSNPNNSNNNNNNSNTTPAMPASTSNAVSAIKGLYKYNGADARLMNISNAAAALGSTAEANRAGAQLSPASNAVVSSQVSSAPTQTVLNVAGAHVDGLRTAQAEGIGGVSTGESANRVALWGQAFGGKSRQSQRDNISGYSADYNGLLIGGDRMIGDAWRVGGLFSYANTAVSSKDDNAGSSMGLKSYGLIAYGGYTADNWYLDLSGGVVEHKYSSTRVINFTGVNGVANGAYNGVQTVLSAQAGYPIRLDARTVLTPIAGVNYSRLKQNGYTESGGNGAALTVASNKSSSFKTDLGTKLERSYDTSYGVLAPSMQLTWRHEFQNTRLRTVANYAIDTGTSFTTEGASPIANMGILALAATLTRTDNITLTARYTVEAASGYVGQTADVRLRYQF